MDEKLNHVISIYVISYAFIEYNTGSAILCYLDKPLLFYGSIWLD